MNQHNKKEPVIENKNSLPIPSRTLDPPIRLIDRAREIEQAHQSLQNHVNSKLDLILKQIRFLQKEAEEIIQQAEYDLSLHQVTCAFEKSIDQILHLYEKENGERYFSLLSPKDWLPAHRYIGSYRLRPDQTFELIGESL